MIDFKDLAEGKIKLEFGNSEQIEAIRRQENFIKFQEEEIKKKLFEVTISISGTSTIRVRARDREEAEELAQDEIGDDYEIDYVKVDDVRQIK